LTYREYTLLIVESPVIANQLRNLQIPWLEIISTDGFLWKPEYNSDTETLAAIADPKKRNVRKEIKTISDWAAKIIIATDNDPAGDFIAWSIMKFLGDKPLYRIFLQSLSLKSITNQISQASKVSIDDLKSSLESSYLFQKYWRAEYPEISPDLAALVYLTSEQFNSNEYRDEHGNLYVLVNYGKRNQEKSQYYKVSLNDVEYHSAKPVSTFNLFFKAARKNEVHFKEISHNLFHLFTNRVLSGYTNLINYPRTAANFYYPATWKLIDSYLYKSSQKIQVKPETIREKPGFDHSHESIRPVDFTANPEKIRHLLPGDLFSVYKIIFNSFTESITVQRKPMFHPTGSSAKFILTDQLNHTAPKNFADLKPCLSISELGRQLNLLGVTRPSKFAKQLDEWIDQGYIINDKGMIRHGTELPRFSERIGESVQLLKKAQHSIQNKSTSELKSLFS
jgi:5S rRNA maturation endonuclease (ribonuclease M5)